MKKVPPRLCVLTKDAKTSAFFVFPSLAQSSQRGREEAYKTFRDTTTSTVKCRHTHTDTWTCKYTQCGFSLGPANEALQPVQKDNQCTQTHSHSQFGGYMGRG